MGKGLATMAAGTGRMRSREESQGLAAILGYARPEVRLICH